MKVCRDAYNRGHRHDGIFSIYIPVIGLSEVRCDITTTPPGGWIIFQRRIDGSVDFYRNWADYKEGFGDLNGNFWLGLEKLHQLAAPGKGAKLRVDLKHMDFPGEIRYAEYSIFEISNEANGYKLKVDGYSGTAGDSLTFHNGMKYTTKDRDNDASGQNSAIVYHSAWWHVSGHRANLNGIFPPDNNIHDPKYMSWYYFNNHHGRIIYSEMKINF